MSVYFNSLAFWRFPTTRRYEEDNMSIGRLLKRKRSRGNDGAVVGQLVPYGDSVVTTLLLIHTLIYRDATVYSM